MEHRLSKDMSAELSLNTMENKGITNIYDNEMKQLIKVIMEIQRCWMQVKRMNIKRITGFSELKGTAYTGRPKVC